MAHSPLRIAHEIGGDTDDRRVHRFIIADCSSAHQWIPSRRT
jgi:hypothetical protein